MRPETMATCPSCGAERPESVGVVVSTLVLYTVDDEPRALGEVRRFYDPAASCCSFSTSAPMTNQSRAGRTACFRRMSAWCTAATETVQRRTTSARSDSRSLRPITARPHAPPAFVRPLIVGVTKLPGRSQPCPRSLIRLDPRGPSARSEDRHGKARMTAQNRRCFCFCH
jgi:hypothetical protein